MPMPGSISSDVLNARIFELQEELRALRDDRDKWRNHAIRWQAAAARQLRHDVHRLNVHAEKHERRIASLERYLGKRR